MYIIKGTFTDKVGGTFWINLREHRDTLQRTVLVENATVFETIAVAEEKVEYIHYKLLRDDLAYNFKLEVIKKDKI